MLKHMICSGRYDWQKRISEMQTTAALMHWIFFPDKNQLHFILGTCKVKKNVIETRLVFPFPQQTNQEFQCSLKIMSLDNMPCSLKINATVPLFPKTPGRGSFVSIRQPTQHHSFLETKPSHLLVRNIRVHVNVFIISVFLSRPLGRTTLSDLVSLDKY